MNWDVTVDVQAMAKGTAVYCGWLVIDSCENPSAALRIMLEIR